jgi:hypothetical protein
MNSPKYRAKVNARYLLYSDSKGNCFFIFIYSSD